MWRSRPRSCHRDRLLSATADLIYGQGEYLMLVTERERLRDDLVKMADRFGHDRMP